MADLTLSKRETQVLTMLAEGKLQKQIAHDLQITEAAVQTHVRNACRRNKTRSTIVLVVRAVRQGAI